MIVNVLYFAEARERVGRPLEPVEIEDGAHLEDVLALLERLHPELAPLWPHLAVAVDGVLAARAAVLREGAEIALLPPVSGG
ncbi:MAG: MoaD/ThiS family protein [Candidatus Eiseniibacteriota bacterium]